MLLKGGEVILPINLVSNNHGLTKIHVVWAYPLVYIIKCGFLFVVCVFCPFVNSFLNGHNLSCDWNFLIGQKESFSVRWVVCDEYKIKF